MEASGTFDRVATDNGVGENVPFEVIVTDFRWAYDVEMKRAERADTLATALIAFGGPTAALLLTALRGRHLTELGHIGVWLVGVGLFFGTFAAAWARFSFVPWPKPKLHRPAAPAVTPMDSVMELWWPESRLLAGSKEKIWELQVAAWHTRVAGARTIADDKAVCVGVSLGFWFLSMIGFVVLLV